jgi:hypothetical protein
MPWVNVEITEGEKNVLAALRKPCAKWKSGKERLESIHQVATRLLKEKINVEFSLYENEIKAKIQVQEEAKEKPLGDITT